MPSAGSKTRATTNRPPGFAELEDLLAEHLATRVRVDEQGKRGRIVIEFAGLDDLERIYRTVVEGGGPSTAS